MNGPELIEINFFAIFQLIFGENPELPSTFADKPLALIQHDTSKILIDNLTALHKARQAFISGERKYNLQFNYNII